MSSRAACTPDGSRTYKISYTEDLTDPDVVVSALARRWGVSVASMTYRPVGFGSHHWAVVDAAARGWVGRSLCARQPSRRLSRGVWWWPCFRFAVAPVGSRAGPVGGWGDGGDGAVGVLSEPPAAFVNQVVVVVADGSAVGDAGAAA